MAVTTELAVLYLGGFAFFRQKGNTLAEAAGCAILTALMGLSFVFQLAFLSGMPALYFLVEVVLLPLSLFFCVRLRGHIFALGPMILNFIRSHAFGTTALVLAWAAVLVKVFVYPAAYRIEAFGLDPGIGTSLTALTDAGASLFPANHCLLPRLFTRFHITAGAGIFGLSAYVAIGFTTYALARRYAWPPTAFTATMVTVSMPRLVLLANSSGEEILPAATALLSILAVYRAVEQPNIVDLSLLVLGILFTIAGGPMGLVFPSILLLLSMVLLFRRHGTLAWRAIIAARWKVTLLLLPVAVVFSQGWGFVYNLHVFGTWFGGPDASGFQANTDGLQGGFANLLRYLIESIHLTRPMDALCTWGTGASPAAGLEKVHADFILPLFGYLGSVKAFKISWVTESRLAWFGPLGFFLTLPAFGYALVRGPRRLKALGVALAGYVYLVALIPAWAPENVRFFTVFFVCSGFFTAFFLPPWRLTRTGKRFLQTVSILLLIYYLMVKIP
jgi:hypothetical protein